MSTSSAYFTTAAAITAATLIAAVAFTHQVANAAPLGPHSSQSASQTQLVAAKSAVRNLVSQRDIRGYCSRKTIFFENCNWLQTTCGGRVVNFRKLNCPDLRH